MALEKYSIYYQLPVNGDIRRASNFYIFRIVRRCNFATFITTVLVLYRDVCWYSVQEYQMNITQWSINRCQNLQLCIAIAYTG